LNQVGVAAVVVAAVGNWSCCGRSDNELLKLLRRRFDIPIRYPKKRPATKMVRLIFGETAELNREEQACLVAGKAYNGEVVVVVDMLAEERNRDALLPTRCWLTKLFDGLRELALATLLRFPKSLEMTNAAGVSLGILGFILSRFVVMEVLRFFLPTIVH